MALKQKAKALLSKQTTQNLILQLEILETKGESPEIDQVWDWVLETLEERHPTEMDKWLLETCWTLGELKEVMVGL